MEQYQRKTPWYRTSYGPHTDRVMTQLTYIRMGFLFIFLVICFPWLIMAGPMGWGLIALMVGVLSACILIINWTDKRLV